MYNEIANIISAVLWIGWCVCVYVYGVSVALFRAL
jgi:hypothetical protein